MALNTETAGAEARAYASATDLDAYATDFARPLVDASGNAVTETADKESALRQGQLLLGYYATRWPGKRATETQALDWPRAEATYLDKTAIGSGVIPREVRDANCEAAIHALANPESVRTVVTGLTTKRVQAGDLSREYFEPKDGTGPVRATFTALDDLLGRLLTPKATSTATSGGGTGTATQAKGFLLAGSSKDDC